MRGHVGSALREPCLVSTGVLRESVPSAFLFYLVLPRLTDYLRHPLEFDGRCCVHTDDVAVFTSAPTITHRRIRPCVHQTVDAVRQRVPPQQEAPPSSKPRHSSSTVRPLPAMASPPSPCTATT
ncbi:hypothetical protein HPB50_026471 [Hyalomma asiaticum]|uniref:Uncharacterized protein n=1 Tax=Hyalomma asiaticum TaxID=266040 RepID=A0ACB7T088_HYAAI|nr:hypothetical protein HPB50_026471 [Hyalomma asiaticum]